MIADQEIRQVFYREQIKTSIPHPPGKDAAAPVVNSRPLRDIRYRGFLTFRGLRLVALIFMSLSQLSMLLVPAARICVVDYLLGMIPRLDTWGFGKSTMMWLCIPAVMLYSFNKMPKHKVLNGVVPLYYLAHYAFIVFMWMLILIFMLGSISGVVQLPEM